MTNSYDIPDRTQNSLILEDRDGIPQYRVEQRGQAHLAGTSPAVKGHLSSALRLAAQEAQTLANYYDALTKQLTLLIDQVENTK